MDISNPFHAQLVQDLHSAAERHQCNLLLSTVTSEQDEQKAAETLLDSRCGGLVLLGPAVPAQNLGVLVDQVPVVILGRPSPAPGADVVRTDDNVGLNLAVSHLRGLGHHRITYVNGGADAASPIRQAAYQQAMHRHDLAAHIRIVSGGDTENAGALAARTVQDCPAPSTAIIAFNDRSAIGIVDGLRRAGTNVPGGVSVIGYDDSPVARLGHVDITTVTQNTRLLAEHTMAQLAQRLAGNRSIDSEVIVPPTLAVRSTTAPPPPETSKASTTRSAATRQY